MGSRRQCKGPSWFAMPRIWRGLIESGPAQGRPALALFCALLDQANQRQRATIEITQARLGHMVGLSPRRTNSLLQFLRAMKFIDYEARRDPGSKVFATASITILADLPRLKRTDCNDEADCTPVQPEASSDTDCTPLHTGEAEAVCNGMIAINCTADIDRPLQGVAKATPPATGNYQENPSGSALGGAVKPPPSAPKDGKEIAAPTSPFHW